MVARFFGVGEAVGVVAACGEEEAAVGAGLDEVGEREVVEGGAGGELAVLGEGGAGAVVIVGGGAVFVGVVVSRARHGSKPGV